MCRREPARTAPPAAQLASSRSSTLVPLGPAPISAVRILCDVTTASRVSACDLLAEPGCCLDGAMTTTAADSAFASGGVPEGTAPEPTDENIWLEDIYGEEQLAWVREQNARTEDLLEDAEYARLEGGILEVLDSTDKIAMVTKRGDWYYNFWKDRENPKGLWRRTTWESYSSDAP